MRHAAHTTFAMIAMLCLTVVAAADTKLKTKTSASGQSFESTVYVKGPRQRSEQMGMATINQCDLKRTIQLNDKAKTYLISSTGQRGSPASSSAQAAPDTNQKPEKPESRRGGVVTYTTTITDTGERKQIFGFTARHIKTAVEAESSPEACSQVKMKMETDAWYIDLEIPDSCPSSTLGPEAFEGFGPSGCKDQVRQKTIGNAKLGYPIQQTITMYAEDGRPNTMTIEVIELSKAQLDPALFEIPADYKEAKNELELMGISATMGVPSVEGMPNVSEMMAQLTDAAGQEQSAPVAIEPKKPGTIRIGVVAINNRTNRQIGLGLIRNNLIGALNGGNIEAIPIETRSSTEVHPEAKQKECDFVLYTEIAALKKSSGGGMFGKVTQAMSGASVVKDKYEAKVDYKLYANGGSSAVLSGSQSAKTGGGVNVVGALQGGMAVGGMVGFNPMGVMGGFGMGAFGGGMGFGNLLFQQGTGLAMNLMMNSMMSRTMGDFGGMRFGLGLEKEEEKTLMMAVAQAAKAVVAGVQKR